MRAVAKALAWGIAGSAAMRPSLVVDSRFDHAPFRLLQLFVLTPFCWHGWATSDWTSSGSKPRLGRKFGGLCVVSVQ
jgi:hypothetical protein